MRRRDVLRGAAGVAAFAGAGVTWSMAEENKVMGADQEAGGGAALPQGIDPARQQRRGDVIYRKLGEADEWVSALGVGGFHIGNLEKQEEAIKLIRTAIDRGINFMDNCWDYHNGKSEEWMGAALKDGYREKVFLMTKLDGRTKTMASRQIDESLKRLQTDHVDLMQIHENIRMEDADRCFAKDGAIEALEAAKKAGKIRYVGFTGHKDPQVHLRMLEVAARHKYQFTTAQMPINPLDASFRSFTRVVVPRLLEHKVALLGMKPMASGAIVQNKIATPDECLRFALTMPTSVVISGMDSMDVLEKNLNTLKEFKPLSQDEVNALISRTQPKAIAGEFEKFKTDSGFDSTAMHPEWLGESSKS